MSEHTRTKVLYIAGTSRSGSTILGQILGQLDGCTYGGELSVVCNRGLIQNRLCGCGEKFADCETWQATLRAAFGDPAGIDAHLLTQIRDYSFLPWNIGKVRQAANLIRADMTITPPRKIQRKIVPEAIAYFAHFSGELCRAIASVRGASVVVDSSHSAIYGYLLSIIPYLDVHVVHLVRDPRAVVYSRRRKKYDPGSNRNLPIANPAKVASAWSLWNLLTEILHGPGNYLRLRYEDFALRPRTITKQIAEFIGEKPEDSYFEAEDRLLLKPAHSVAGNPTRYETGLTVIRSDDQWIEDISPTDKLLVTALTWPLLLRYGYALNPSKS